MGRKREVAFEFGRRLTFRVHVPSTQKVQVDVYPFHPPIETHNPKPLEPLAWVLYLPNPEQDHSRRSVPSWLHDTCAQRGWPLVVLDNPLLPEGADQTTALASILESLLEQGGKDSYLNWALLSTGPGAEADTGDDALDDKYYFDFVPHGGLDFDRMALVAPAEVATLASKALVHLPKPKIIVALGSSHQTSSSLLTPVPEDATQVTTLIKSAIQSPTSKL